jgi:hypothetical protein
MMKKKADALGDEFADELRRQILGPAGAPTEAEAGAARPAPSSSQKWHAWAVAAAIIVLLAWFITR